MSEADRQVAIEQEALLESFGITPMRFHFVALRQAMIDGGTWYMNRTHPVPHAPHPIEFKRKGAIVQVIHIGSSRIYHWPLDNFYAWTEQQFTEQITKIINGGSK